MENKNTTTMEQIVSLAKRRGFVYPGSEIYGGLANSWDYGPLGAQLKKNIKDHWWRFFVQRRDDMVGLDAALVMNPKVWEASGHTANFSDPLVECKKCHARFRADQIDLSKPCAQCKAKDSFTQSQAFNLMLKTFLGPVDGWAEWSDFLTRLNSAKNFPEELEEVIKYGVEVFHQTGKSIAYFRPETAQAMFVDFKNVLDTTRSKLPFGIAQIGKAFRNEITPGNFIFRTREFEQMEIEYFFNPDKTDWKALFEEWKGEIEKWMKEVGIDLSKVHAVDIPDGDRAHYSKRTIDFEFDYPFGQKELFGLAYRGNYDLTQHEKASGQELRYLDPETGEKILPHVIEPSLGVDRAFLAVLLSAYAEESVADGDMRIVLHLPPTIAPVQVAVFPLLKNKTELVGKARGVYTDLKKTFLTVWDDNGNIGKRYRRQDEIGTPYCITIDFDTLEDGTVTVRDRDTLKQERVAIVELKNYLSEKLIS